MDILLHSVLPKVSHHDVPIHSNISLQLLSGSLFTGARSVCAPNPIPGRLHSWWKGRESDVTAHRCGYLGGEGRKEGLHTPLVFCLQGLFLITLWGSKFIFTAVPQREARKDLKQSDPPFCLLLRDAACLDCSQPCVSLPFGTHVGPRTGASQGPGPRKQSSHSCQLGGDHHLSILAHDL